MPGIDTEGGAAGIDALPDRLADLLLAATSMLEREAAQAKVDAEALARKVGVIARSGAALALFGARQARRAAQAARGEPVSTEEADMDDAEDAAPRGAGYSDADYERCARNLSRNLRLGTDDRGPAQDHGAGGAGEGHGELGGARAPPPVAARG